MSMIEKLRLSGSFCFKRFILSGGCERAIKNLGPFYVFSF